MKNMLKTSSLRIILFLTLQSLLWPYSSAVGETFSIPTACIKLAYPIEKLICSNNDLNQQDMILNNIFHYATAWITEENRKQIVLTQRHWLKDRLSVCSIPTRGNIKDANIRDATNCLIDMYKKRINQLQSDQLSFPLPVFPKCYSDKTMDSEERNALFFSNIIDKKMNEASYVTLFGKKDTALLKTSLDEEMRQEGFEDKYGSFIDFICQSSHHNYIASLGRYGVYLFYLNSDNGTMDRQQITGGSCNIERVVTDQSKQAFAVLRCGGISRYVMYTSYELIAISNPSLPSQTIYSWDDDPVDGGCSDSPERDTKITSLSFIPSLEQSGKSGSYGLKFDINEENCKTKVTKRYTKRFIPTKKGFIEKVSP